MVFWVVRTAWRSIPWLMRSEPRRIIKAWFTPKRLSTGWTTGWCGELKLVVITTIACEEEKILNANMLNWDGAKCYGCSWNRFLFYWSTWLQKPIAGSDLDKGNKKGFGVDHQNIHVFPLMIPNVTDILEKGILIFLRNTKKSIHVDGLQRKTFAKVVFNKNKHSVKKEKHIHVPVFKEENIFWTGIP